MSLKMRATLRGALVGVALYAVVVMILLFSGDLSGSKFLYVDF